MDKEPVFGQNRRDAPVSVQKRYQKEQIIVLLGRDDTQLFQNQSKPCLPCLMGIKRSKQDDAAREENSNS
jgi:hypothetical protein